MTSTQGKIPPFSFPFPLGFLILFCILLIGEGCSGPFLYSRTIHEGRYKYVKLEARYGDGQRGASMEFSHPVSLSETDWARILKSIFVKPQQRLFIETKEIVSRQLFSKSDLLYLANCATLAFTKAHSGEWVVFYLSDPQETGVTEITSGGLFVEDSKLHFVLANYRQLVTMPFIQQEIWHNPLKPAGETFYDIVQQPHQTLRTERRWDLTQSLRVTVPELEIDYTALLILPPDNQEQRTPAQSKGTFSQGEETQLVDKLRMLRQLHEEGLITEKEYRQKRQKLMEDL